jgi:hypothetical protein
VFLKEGYMARGSIQSDGSYTVGSLTENDGLPDGEYQVYIEGAEVEDPQSPSGMRSMTRLWIRSSNRSAVFSWASTARQVVVGERRLQSVVRLPLVARLPALRGAPPRPR